MISPDQLAQLPRDTKREMAVAQELRGMSETERLRYITDLARSHARLALIFANQTLLKRQSFVHLLYRALETANAQSMGTWLTYIVPRVGLRRVARILEEEIANRPISVNFAMYWMWRHARPNSEQDRQILVKVISALEKSESVSNSRSVSEVPRQDGPKGASAEGGEIS
jgi:hypothetical protein